MKPLVLIVFFVCSIGTFAQVNPNALTSDLLRVDEYVKKNDNEAAYTLDKNVKGSPYFNDEFVLGNIYEGNKLLATETPIRYNIYSNEIEVKENLEDPDEEAKPLPKDSNIFVKINDAIIVLIPFNGSDEEGHYFQVLYEGKKVGLLKKVEKEYTTPKKANTSITRDLMGAFTDNTTFFLQTRNGRMFELPKTKAKKFLVFGKHAAALEAYAVENQLNINKDMDLRRLVMHFDSL